MRQATVDGTALPTVRNPSVDLDSHSDRRRVGRRLELATNDSPGTGRLVPRAGALLRRWFCGVGRGGRLFSARARGVGVKLASRACVALGVRIFSNSMHDEDEDGQVYTQHMTQHEPEVRLSSLPAGTHD